MHTDPNFSGTHMPRHMRKPPIPGPHQFSNFDDGQWAGGGEPENLNNPQHNKSINVPNAANSISQRSIDKKKGSMQKNKECKKDKSQSPQRNPLNSQSDVSQNYGLPSS